MIQIRNIVYTWLFLFVCIYIYTILNFFSGPLSAFRNVPHNMADEICDDTGEEVLTKPTATGVGSALEVLQNLRLFSTETGI